MKSARPTIDHRLSSISVPRSLMPSLLAARTSPGRESPPELASSELFVAGRLDPLVASLLEVMTDPDLVVSAEISEGGGLRLITFWRRGRSAVIGSTAQSGQFHIALVDAELLPFHLAQSVRLTPRGQPRYAGHFTVPRPVLAVARRKAALEPASAEAELVAAGIAPVWAERLVAGFLLQQSRWAMESVSLALPRASSSLAVMDSAQAGLWRLRPVERDLLMVSPVGFDELLTLLAALVP